VVTVNGVTFASLQEAAGAYGVPYGTAWSRYRKKGWTIEQSLGLAPPPVRPRRTPG